MKVRNLIPLLSRLSEIVDSINGPTDSENHQRCVGCATVDGKLNTTWEALDTHLTPKEIRAVYMIAARNAYIGQVKKTTCINFDDLIAAIKVYAAIVIDDW